MSNDPKKPFDAPPTTTPSILQKDMELERRNRLVPAFDQLRARPTAPMGAPLPPPSRQAPPSPTEWANRQHVAPTVPPARVPAPAPATQLSPQHQAQRLPEPAAAEPLGGGEDEPTRVAPYNVPGRPAPLPPGALASAPRAPRTAPLEPTKPYPLSTPAHASVPVPTSPYDEMTIPETRSPVRTSGSGLRDVPAELKPASSEAPPPPARSSGSSAATPARSESVVEVPLSAGDSASAPEAAAPAMRSSSSGLRAAPTEAAPVRAKAPGTSWKKRDPNAPPLPLIPGPSSPTIEASELAPAPAPAPAPLEHAAAKQEPLFDPEPPPPERVADAPPPRAARAARAAPVAKASVAKAPAPVAGEVHASPASLFRRTVSWAVDLIVIGGLVGALMFVAMTLIFPTSAATGVGSAAAAKLVMLEKVALPAAALAALIAFVYSALFAFLWQGRTFGRRLVGIHLVDNSGSAPGPVRALFRAMLSVVSFAFFLSGFWLALFDRKGQTLHDKLSRTFVVRLGADAT